MGRGFSNFKSLHTSIRTSSKMQSSSACNSYMTMVKLTDSIHLRPTFSSLNNNYHKVEFSCTINMKEPSLKNPVLKSHFYLQRYDVNHVPLFSPKLSYLNLRGQTPIVLISSTFNCRSYSSFFGGKGDKSGNPEVSDSYSNDSSVSDLVGRVKEGCQSVIDAAAHTGQKIKEGSDELTPHVQQLLDSLPYLRSVIIPISCTLTATVLAWVVMPRILRRFHMYSIQGPAAILSGNLSHEQIPYEESFWNALEGPVRYLITFISFSQIGMMIAPTTIASQYIAPAWRGAVILSFIWFLYRWKTLAFNRALTSQRIAGIGREKVLALDKLSSLGLFVLGVMALAEACGVAVQSILTIGGIGGVATAFAARDILGNVLSGLSMQFSRPFSIGDTIKAGSIEGQVVEMGLTTTSLLNPEKFPVIVPNSLFSSQVIVNKSRAQWRAMVSKIPLQISSLDKIPEISNDIKLMLKSNSKVFLGKEAPYCFLSRVDSSCAELTVGCNLKTMSKDELYSTEQDILLQSVHIIKQHGAALGITS